MRTYCPIFKVRKNSSQETYETLFLLLLVLILSGKDELPKMLKIRLQKSYDIIKKLKPTRKNQNKTTQISPMTYKNHI